MITSELDRPWAYRDSGQWSTAARPSALAFHWSLPGYRSTPLREAPEPAREAGVGRCWVKDESDRLGLPAFKVLGASWATNCALSTAYGGAPADSLEALRDSLGNHRPTLVTATDGNHGRALAWMARLLGLRAQIYLPTGVSDAAQRAIRGEGAEIVLTGRIYDEAVALAAASCKDDHDRVLIQDTSWPGYTEIPQRIVDGYQTLFAEIDNQLGDQRPDLVVVPTGVGSLLQAALEHYRSPAGQQQPAVLAVEPVTAACVTSSLAAGTMITVDTSSPTIMAGLNCGSVSDNAWPAISGALDAGIPPSYWSAPKASRLTPPKCACDRIRWSRSALRGHEAPRMSGREPWAARPCMITSTAASATPPDRSNSPQT